MQHICHPFFAIVLVGIGLPFFGECAGPAAISPCTPDPPPGARRGRTSFATNTLDGDYQCRTLGTWKLLIPEIAKGCKPVKPGARRLSTSGNTKTSKPCSL